MRRITLGPKGSTFPPLSLFTNIGTDKTNLLTAGALAYLSAFEDSKMGDTEATTCKPERKEDFWFVGVFYG